MEYWCASVVALLPRTWMCILAVQATRWRTTSSSAAAAEQRPDENGSMSGGSDGGGRGTALTDGAPTGMPLQARQAGARAAGGHPLQQSLRAASAALLRKYGAVGGRVDAAGPESVRKEEEEEGSEESEAREVEGSEEEGASVEEGGTDEEGVSEEGSEEEQSDESESDERGEERRKTVRGRRKE